MAHSSPLGTKIECLTKPPPLPSEQRLVLPPKLAPESVAIRDSHRVLAWVIAGVIAFLFLISAVVLLVRPLKPEVAKEEPIRPSPRSTQPISSETAKGLADKEPFTGDSSVPEANPAEEQLPETPVAPETPAEDESATREPPSSPANGDTPPKQSITDSDLWPIPPSFPREPAMMDGKPTGNTSTELLTLPTGAEVTQLELVGAPKTKSDGNLPAFRLVSSGNDVHSWSLNLRSLASEREIALVRIEGTRLVLQWKVANPKQIAAALGQLSACALLVSVGDNSQQLIPLSYQKADVLTYGVPTITKASEFFLTDAVMNEVQFMGFEFHNGRGDWTLDPPPTTNGQSRKCIVKHASADAIESHFSLQRLAGDSTQGYSIAWDLVVNGQKVRKDQLALISNLQNLLAASETYSRRLQELESQALDLESSGSRSAMRENRQKRDEVMQKLEELKKLAKGIGVSSEQLHSLAKDDGNGQHWPGAVSCYIVRKVNHNGKDLLIPLVQVGDPHSP